MGHFYVASLVSSRLYICFRKTRGPFRFRVREEIASIMSKRRAFGDVVQKDDGDGEPPYLVMLIPTADGAEPDYCMFECGDPECREWRIAEILDKQAHPTGKRIYHVAECCLSDPPS